MIQVIEMNREIKCKNPTVEEVVLAGWWLLIPVSLPFLQLLGWFCHTWTWVVAPVLASRKLPRP